MAMKYQYKLKRFVCKNTGRNIQKYAKQLYGKGVGTIAQMVELSKYKAIGFLTIPNSIDTRHNDVRL